MPASSRLFSGTINGAGQLDLRVTRLAADTTLSKLATMVREAETQASPTQRFTDRFERIFVPVVIGLVFVVLVVGPLVGSSWSESFYRAMAVLVAASPCALAIATPSAVLAAVARAGQLGVLVKGGGPLENLGTLRAMAFDKTGTLTEGRPRLTDVAPADGVDESELLSIAVAVESRSDHPLAAAIVRDGAARLDGAPLPAVSDVSAITGRGVRASVDGAAVFIGNAALFDDIGGVEAAVASLGGRAPGCGPHDHDREERRPVPRSARPDGHPPTGARDAVAALQQVGIRRAIMLSGDHQLVAESIAGEVGLTDAWGDLMPEDKVAAIERLRTEEGKVAMVGDGVNDAPALAHATVGIAMGAAGSDVALETADIALMGDDLAKLPVVIGLSRKASRIIRQNLYLSLGMVAFLIPATHRRVRRHRPRRRVPRRLHPGRRRQRPAAPRLPARRPLPCLCRRRHPPAKPRRSHHDLRPDRDARTTRVEPGWRRGQAQPWWIEAGAATTGAVQGAATLREAEVRKRRCSGSLQEPVERAHSGESAASLTSCMRSATFDGRSGWPSRKNDGVPESPSARASARSASTLAWVAGSS